MTVPPFWEEPREPFIRAPAIVFIAIGTLLAVQIFDALAPAVYRSNAVTWFALIPARFDTLSTHGAGDAIAVLITLVSYVFLHDDLMHVLVNCICLLAAGTPVARRIGTSRFLAFCFVTAVCAALAHVATHLGSSVPRMGASGIVFGMTGAFARFMFLDSRQPAVWPRATQPLLTRSVLVWAAIWTASILALGLFQASTGALTAYPDWEGHLGGFYAGLLLFPLFDRHRTWLR